MDGMFFAEFLTGVQPTVYGFDFWSIFSFFLG